MWKNLHEHHAETATFVDAGVVRQVLGKQRSCQVSTWGPTTLRIQVQHSSHDTATTASFEVFTRRDVMIGRLSWKCSSGSDEADNGENGYDVLHCCGAVSVTKVMV